MYEEAAKVPLFLKFPKGFIPVQKEINQVVSHVDVLPTLCDYLKIKPSNKMDGESWLPLLSGKVTDDGEGTAFLQYDGNGSRSNFQRCIVRGRKKLIIDFSKMRHF